jgi:hypothetical protein
MRIKVCLFKSSDVGLAADFADAMVHRLIEAKVVEISPFGYIPLDRKVGPEEGFDDKVKPEPDTLYILLEGWIRNSSSGFSIEPAVIYRDPQGAQHVLQGAANPPAAFSKQTLERTAGMVVNWGIETARDYAAS